MRKVPKAAEVFGDELADLSDDEKDDDDNENSNPAINPFFQVKSFNTFMVY